MEAMEINKMEFAVVPEKIGKIVSDASVARKLLKDGFKIIDIKPKRNHDRETVFVFENSDEMIEKMEEYVKAKKNSRNKKEEKAEKPE